MGERGTIGFKGEEGRPGDPGLTGIKVCVVFCFRYQIICLRCKEECQKSFVHDSAVLTWRPAG